MEIKQTSDLMTFYPDKENNAVVTCPHCTYSKTINALKYKDTGNVLKAKCRCGKIFSFTIDFRKFYRKKVRLPGEYVIIKNQRKGDMLVEDVSMGGIGFTDMTWHKIEAGDILEIKFTLDDKNRTALKRKVKVLIIKGHFIGTEFVEKNRFDKDLGFYLSP